MPPSVIILSQSEQTTSKIQCPLTGNIPELNKKNIHRHISSVERPWETCFDQLHSVIFRQEEQMYDKEIKYTS